MVLSIVMPCLNEAETLAQCIDMAKRGIADAGVPGEIVIADNGSTDGSQRIAEELGARVVPVAEKGYGCALRGGIESARGRYLLMGDSDASYDFGEAKRFVQKLDGGLDLVMGCRLPAGGGTIMPGAMPWKNRWLGNPVLSFIGRLLYRTPVRDFHCGLRGFTRDAYDRMALVTTGMEFASEMVMKASMQQMRITEVPITLHKDGRSRPPHLRPWRDGWRHLRFMLLYAPRWLFLVPGLVLSGVGALASLLLFFGPLSLLGLELDAGSLAISCGALIAGVQLLSFAFFTKTFGIGAGVLPQDAKFACMFRTFTLERGLILGLLVLLGGAGLLAWAIWCWGQTGFGHLPYSENVRRTIAAATLLVLGMQIIFGSFFMSVLGLKTTKSRPPEA